MVAVRGVRAHASSHVQLEASARNARRQLLAHLELDAPLTDRPVLLFEGLQGKRLRCSEGVLPINVAVREDLGPGVEGVTSVTADKVLTVALAELSYVGLEAGKARGLFTFAHELGHVFEHTALLMRAAIMPHVYGLARDGTHKPYEDTEFHANNFAACLLAPAAGLEAMLRAGRLWSENVSRRYGLSLEAAAYRIDTFNKKREQLRALNLLSAKEDE